MKTLDIIDHHQIIRNTIGYRQFEKVKNVCDVPSVMEFLKIVDNYGRMKRILDK